MCWLSNKALLTDDHRSSSRARPTSADTFGWTLQEYRSSTIWIHRDAVQRGADDHRALMARLALTASFMRSSSALVRAARRRHSGEWRESSQRGDPGLALSCWAPTRRTRRGKAKNLREF